MCALLEFPQAFSQTKVSYGFSLNQGLSILSNKQEAASDGHVNQPPTSVRPIGLWRTSSMSLDSYWAKKKIVVSFGLSAFRYQVVVDSLVSPYATALIYGQLMKKSTVFLPSVRFAYRVRLHEHLYYSPSISLGVTEVMSRYKREALAYDPSDQEYWDQYQYNDATNTIEFDKSAMLIEFRNSLVYDLQRWSLSGGVSYNFYRNLPMEGYHGLHLNVGCSWRFKDDIFRSEHKKTPTI